MTLCEQILRYDFRQVNSTIVADCSGCGQAGVIRNYDKGGATVSAERIFGSESHILHLPGGKEGGYLEFPNGVLKGSDSCTVSLFFRCIECTGRRTLFSIGSDSIFSVLLEPVSEHEFNCAAAATSGGLSQAAFSDPVRLYIGEWYCLSVTFDTVENENRITLYINGIRKTSFTQKRALCRNVSRGEEGFIGFGPFSYQSLAADITRVIIFSGIPDDEEIASLFNVSDRDRIDFDVKALEPVSDSMLEKDIPLPSSGLYGTAFKWSSSDESLLSTQGHINRPEAGTAPAHVILTLTAQNGNTSLSFDFPLLIKPLPSVCDILGEELDGISPLFTSPVVSDIELPRSLNCGAGIMWTSSAPDIVSCDGKVHRPAASETEKIPEMILTAKACLGDSCVTREYRFTVPAQKEKLHVLSTENITLEVIEGTAPLLPSMVKVRLSSGRCEPLLVEWPDISEAMKERNGADTFDIKGKLRNYGNEVTATLHFSQFPAPSGLPSEHTGRHARLQDVLLTGKDIYTGNRDRCLKYLKLLDCNRMLYNFRLTFGVDTMGAEPLGGWDEPTGLLRGHSTGHFLSALALSYASTSDAEIKNKLDYMVNELGCLQRLSKGNARDFRTTCTPADASQSKWSHDCSTWGKGYLGAYPPDQFALLEQFTPYATIWAPYYTLHKILAGLIDCYTYAGNIQALRIACRLGDWVTDRLSGTTKEQRSKMWSMYIAGEYGGMNESLASLAIISGNDSYLETAKMFDNPRLFDGLSVNLDTVSGIHANQHIPQIIGALRKYEADGDIRYYRIAAAFWKIVTRHYAYSTGGVGRGEIFKEPDILAGNIDSDRNCETCAMYNMLKLTRKLYEYEPENSAYMDYYERGLLNQIAASQNPTVSRNMHNGVTYMLPIGPGAVREYSSDYDDFTCCHGTGMENHVKYQDSIYFVDESRHIAYINLYISSQLRYPDLLTMTVDHRLQKADIVINSNAGYRLRFRVPSWAASGMYIECNGEKICGTKVPSGYLETDRICRKGDTFTVHFPYSVKLELTPDLLEGSEVASVCYGPFVMTALSNRTEWITLSTFSDPNECFSAGWDEENKYPVLTNFGRRFVPMYAAHNVQYHTYFKINRI